MIGVTSVTFRQLSAERIVELAVKAGLDGIEWGGDIHVPPDNAKTATAVAELTKNAGLQVLSYGSYYRLGEKQDFTGCLESAYLLGAPVIRVWAGNQGSAEANQEYREIQRRDLETICNAAGKQGIRIGLEYHRGTLTDTWQSTAALLDGCANAYPYWQPNPDISPDEQLREIDALRQQLCAIHVFYWLKGNIRKPLAEGEANWHTYLTALASLPVNYIMEFVPDDSPEQFLQDAKILRQWIASAKEKL